MHKKPILPSDLSLRLQGWIPIVLLMLWCGDALACDTLVGQLVSVEGTVEVRPASSQLWLPAARLTKLCPGDIVAARARSQAAVVLSNDVLVRLDQNTTLTLVQVAEDQPSELSLSQGIVHVLSRFKKRLNVVTPYVNALVDGTEFTVDADASHAQVSVAEGRIRAVNPMGEVLIAAGASATAARDAMPAPLEIRPLDAIRWAIHYPQIVVLSSEYLNSLPATTRDLATQAQLDAIAGRYAMAIVAIEHVPTLANIPKLQAFRASLLLAIGRFDEARGIIAQLDPTRNADAASLDAIVNVVTNAPDAALASAQRAVQLDATSVTAQLALSYAQQSQRNLPQALAVAKRATEMTLTSPIAWLRRAEIELSMSQIENGRQSAQLAQTLDAEAPMAGAMLGFADLLAGRTKVAIPEFDAAIAANSAEPLSWYGRGLAHIRLGQLAEGRRELEVAVMLDPTNTELRSTLGRAYQQEGRDKPATSEFELARSLDPASPTPWYFDAIRKQQNNDPIGAVADYREALARNDNRSVLRPDGLIDQDRSAREANLSKAYEDLDWQQAMTVTAQDAVTKDPQSGTAHRFLADAYANSMHTENARVSELLQAQMRQQPGQWPLPPQYYIPGLPILDGPRALSTEETSDLFARQPEHFAASVTKGNHDTQGESLLASHAWQSGQISAGYFNYDTDGWKPGTDLQINANQFNALQQITNSTTLYGELRRVVLDGGDQSQNLVQSSGVPTTRKATQTDLARTGFRTALSNTSEVLGNYSAVQREDNNLTHAVTGPLVVDTYAHSIIDGRFGELQYLWQGSPGSLATGVSSYREGDRSAQQVKITLPPIFIPVPPPGHFVTPPPVISNSQTPGSVTYDNVYANWQSFLSPKWTLHGGLAYQKYSQSDVIDIDRPDPKLGVSFAPTSNLQLRAAVYRSFTGPKAREQALEPTTFDGFNDVFEDIAGT
ncbi:MAG TPA: TonB-dependent receptor, partial [Rhodocyclaceae bacterium]|nr:TonB-dependent receptor [Rhodocyclaceae bacterium]